MVNKVLHFAAQRVYNYTMMSRGLGFSPEVLVRRSEGRHPQFAFAAGISYEGLRSGIMDTDCESLLSISSGAYAVVFWACYHARRRYI